MSTFAEQVIDKLAESDIAAEINSTGGGCEELFIRVGKYAVSVTNGDSELPDSEYIYGYVTEFGETEVHDDIELSADLESLLDKEAVDRAVSVVTYLVNQAEVCESFGE